MADSDEENLDTKYVITRKITWLRADVTPEKCDEIKQDAIEQVDKAMNENTIEKDIATKVKRFFDDKW
eukprot:CAMPEP_0117746164 /NCGR_PEP_ID=MMETSP0947-20121206/7788_1 /TAXON_ID=44440 /ORGANISM="Chattonella subsalsa, Strain CCMP2191" /LENGTH=67 /DNA_ID=CAMNT_0005563445 /DNA_START=50 /DNA_END=250 /DNA_ORIENTATION=+